MFTCAQKLTASQLDLPQGTNKTELWRRNGQESVEAFLEKEKSLLVQMGYEHGIKK